MARPDQLTDSTGQTPDATIANVPAAVAATTDTSAASLASVNTALTAIESSLSDLAAKVNAITSPRTGATFGQSVDRTASDPATNGA